MIIANPIYDVVFRFLMEDLDIAKGLISTIIGEEVLELHFHSQEHTIRRPTESLTVYRLDFLAQVRTATGETKKILIEMQKARLSDDVERFRHYLGSQYQKRDDIRLPDGRINAGSLPLVAIYLLGFDLESHLPACIKVTRDYLNLITGEPVHGRSRFIEALSHDTYVIQVQQVHHQARTDLERVLSVFGQEGFIDNTRHAIDYPEACEKNRLLQRILRRLNQASQEAATQEGMELEDIAFRELERAVAEREAKLQAIIVDERQQKEEERRLKEEERRQKEEERRLKEEECRQKEEERRQKELVMNALRAMGKSEDELRQLLNR